MALETLSEALAKSAEDFGIVHAYAQGDPVLPLQDPVLKEAYDEAIRGYFDFAQRAFTDPHIYDLLRRSNVGKVDHLTFYQQAKGRSIEGEIGLLPPPHGLVIFRESKGLIIDNGVGELAAWEISETMKKYPSVDGNNRWIRVDKLTENGNAWCIYRPLVPEDLQTHPMLHRFVIGVGNTFAALRQAAEKEVGVANFAGETDVDRIQAIIGAFGQANGILSQVFDPTAS